MVRIITQLPIDRWRKYRDLRLFALSDCPFAFQDDLEAEQQLPDKVWLQRLKEYSIYFAEDADQLVGMAGFVRKTGSKMNHVIQIHGVYVRPEQRGQGIAQQLLQAIIDWARSQQGVRKINLGVVAVQRPALGLYQKLGFKIVGTRVGQLRVGEQYYDEHLMELQVTSA